MPEEAAVEEAPIATEVPGLKKTGSTLMAERMTEAMNRNPIVLAPDPAKSPVVTPPAAPVIVTPAEAASKPGAMLAEALAPKPEVKIDAVPEFLKSDDAKKGWAELKQQKAQFEKQVLELQPKLTEYETAIKAKEAEIVTLKAQPVPDKGEIEALRKSVAEYKKIVETVAIEKDPAFESHFNGRVAATINDAKQLVGPDLAQRVESILQLPEGQARRERLEEIALELSESQKLELFSADRDLRQINREKGERLKFAQANYQQLVEQQAKAQQEQVEQRKQKAESTLNATLENAAVDEETFGMLKPRDGNKEWNDSVEKVISEARRLYIGNNDDGTLAKAAIRASLYPSVTEAVKVLAAKVKELNAQILELTAASPTVQSNGTTTTEKPKKWSEETAERLQEATGKR